MRHLFVIPCAALLPALIDLICFLFASLWSLSSHKALQGTRPHTLLSLLLATQRHSRNSVHFPYSRGFVWAQAALVCKDEQRTLLTQVEQGLHGALLMAENLPSCCSLPQKRHLQQ